MDRSWVTLLVNASPFLLLIGFWIFMMRQMQGGQSRWLRSGMRRNIVSDLDRLLIESEKRVAEPKAKLLVRISLAGNQTVEGRIVWANSQFIKYESAKGGLGGIVPKANILKFEALPQ